MLLRECNICSIFEQRKHILWRIVDIIEAHRENIVEIFKTLLRIHFLYLLSWNFIYVTWNNERYNGSSRRNKRISDIAPTYTVHYVYTAPVSVVHESASHLSRDWHDEIDKQRPPQTMKFCHGNNDRRHWILAVVESMYCWYSPAEKVENEKFWNYVMRKWVSGGWVWRGRVWAFSDYENFHHEIWEPSTHELWAHIADCITTQSNLSSHI